MADTIREKILKNIKTTLEGVTVANGYRNTIQAVRRWDKRSNPIDPTPSITIAVGEENKDPIPNPLYTCRLNVFLDVWIRQNETDATPTDEKITSLVGDIEKALMVDNTRGGNAVDTDLKGSTPFDYPDGKFTSGVVVEAVILYQHRISDPEQAT